MTGDGKTIRKSGQWGGRKEKAKSRLISGMALTIVSGSLMDFVFRFVGCLTHLCCLKNHSEERTRVEKLEQTA